MRRVFLALLAIGAVAVASTAQTSPTAGGPAPQGSVSAPTAASSTENSNQLPAGVIIPVELSKSVDSKKAKAGDKIEARTAMDLLSQGKVVIPRNTKIIGHVTEAKAHSKESPDSKLEIVFGEVSMKDGRELRLQTVVQAIGRPLRSAVADSSPMGDSSAVPSASTPTPGGAMGGSMPRSPERVASVPVPTNSTSGADSSSPDRSTVAPLGPTSQGVVGMKGISLNASEKASIISSDTENVHLDSGTQLILRTQ